MREWSTRSRKERLTAVLPWKMYIPEVCRKASLLRSSINTSFSQQKTTQNIGDDGRAPVRQHDHRKEQQWRSLHARCNQDAVRSRLRAVQPLFELCTKAARLRLGAHCVSVNRIKVHFLCPQNMPFNTKLQRGNDPRRWDAGGEERATARPRAGQLSGTCTACSIH